MVGSRQGSCLIISLPTAENALASASKERRDRTGLASLTHASFRGLSLFESSITFRKWLAHPPGIVASHSPSLFFMMV